MSEQKDIRVGDWIRFQRDSRLLLGTVGYITRDSLGYPHAATFEHGEVNFRHVLEVRRQSEDRHA